MKTTMFDVVSHLVTEHDICVTMVTHNGELAFDLDTQTKSRVIVTTDGNVFLRYDERISLDLSDDMEEIITDLCYIVKYAMHGRDFINTNWAELMVKLEVLEKVITQTVMYK